MSQEREKLSPEKSFWGWKLLAISIVLSCIFMWIFYLAITNEPDYMPSQQNKAAQQHNMAEMNHDNMKTETMNHDSGNHDSSNHASMSQEDMAKMGHTGASTSEPMATHHHE